MDGDASKYLHFAQNMLHGFYSPPAPNINLSVGPGYPLLIIPFVAFNLPLQSIVLLNSVFYYLSIVILYKTLFFVIKKQNALIVSLFWGFYYNLFDSMNNILPETIAPFLFSIFLYFLFKAHFSNNGKLKRYLFFAGITLGYIALTKIIFGYVILFLLAGSGFLLLFNRKSVNYRSGLLVSIVALLTLAPYLLYTYQLTGKVFYLGTTAGNNMYWMSTPHEKEYGSWFPEPKPIKDSISLQEKKSVDAFRQMEYNGIMTDDQNIPGTDDYIRRNHLNNFKNILKLSGDKQDDALKQIAFKNIKEHPMKFIENIFSNMGRMLFNFPYSYKLQKPATLLRIPHNGIIAALVLLCLFPTLLNWKQIIYPIRFSVFICCMYFGASLTGSAESRMFSVIVPILLVWISIVLESTVNIKWKFQKNE